MMPMGDKGIRYSYRSGPIIWTKVKYQSSRPTVQHVIHGSAGWNVSGPIPAFMLCMCGNGNNSVNMSYGK